MRCMSRHVSVTIEVSMDDVDTIGKVIDDYGERMAPEDRNRMEYIYRTLMQETERKIKNEVWQQ